VPDTDRDQGPAAASEGPGAGEHAEGEALLLGPFIVSFRGWGRCGEFADQSKHRRRALHHLAGMRFGSFRRPIDRPGMTS